MNTAGTLRALVAEAHQKLREGDAAEAERHAKAVSAIVRAERDVAEYVAASEAQQVEDDEEVLRAEFMERLHRLAAAERAGAPVDVLERIAAGKPSP